MTNEELAYIAGFFDGEGSITIHQNGKKPSPRGKNPNHTLQVAIGNTDPRVLIWIHSVFGGCLLNRKGPTANHRNMAHWYIRTASALRFLEAIRPFVRMKGDQCDVAIAYQRTKVKHGKGKPKTVPQSEIDWREEQRQEIRSLNARAWIH